MAQVWVIGQNQFNGVQSGFTTQMAQPLGSDTRDDSLAMQTYVDNVQAVEESALIQATLRLFGIHEGYEISNLLTKIDGRNISLNRNSEDAVTKKFLQITGIHFDYQNQRTDLITALG